MVVSRRGEVEREIIGRMGNVGGREGVKSDSRSDSERQGTPVPLWPHTDGPRIEPSMRVSARRASARLATASHGAPLNRSRRRTVARRVFVELSAAEVIFRQYFVSGRSVPSAILDLAALHYL